VELDWLLIYQEQQVFMPPEGVVQVTVELLVPLEAQGLVVVGQLKVLMQPQLAEQPAQEVAAAAAEIQVGQVVQAL
jgi:hypothetical protein